MKGSRLDLVGHTYGLWTVVAFAGVKNKKSLWLCRCKCGTEKVNNRHLLRTGQSKGCGCTRLSRVRECNTTHGLSGKRVCRIWHHMIRRCHDPNTEGYADYGGRGIVVCDRWRASIHAFADDMGDPPSPQHSIDRINNDGNYEPSNCRWATAAVQRRNNRYIRMLTYRGKTQCMFDWSLESGIAYSCLFERIKRGWSVEDALTIPSGQRRQ